MNRFYVPTLACLLVICVAAQAQFLPEIRVDANHRYLQTAKGKPFFWLGDTDWELFHRLDRQEAALFLEARRLQGFNVIQAVALAEFEGIRTPNRYGDLPLLNDDPTQLAITPGNNPDKADEYDYWDHVDYIIQTATQKGLYIGLLPTWGDKVAHLWGDGPRIFTPENARAYGKLLGKRYGRYNVIWILGGDRPALYTSRDSTDNTRVFDDRPIWRAMAEGIEAGVGHKPFMTYHPAGGPNSTSQYLQDEKWLDMNAFQSGHGARESPAWEWVSRDLALQPTRPTLDMEPCYEDHPVNPWDGKWTRQRGYFTTYDVRARIYRSVLAGACGVTYGHHQVWQFLDTTRYQPINIGDTLIGWQQAAYAPGAEQVQFLKNLMLSRPYTGRINDQSMLVSAIGRTYRDHIEVARDVDGAYALVYLPQNKSVRINLTKLSGKNIHAWWYDPQTGHATDAGITPILADFEFTPPNTGLDWVLVLDDASRKFGEPGQLAVK